MKNKAITFIIILWINLVGVDTTSAITPVKVRFLSIENSCEEILEGIAETTGVDSLYLSIYNPLFLQFEELLRKIEEGDTCTLLLDDDWSKEKNLEKIDIIGKTVARIKYCSHVYNMIGNKYIPLTNDSLINDLLIMEHSAKKAKMLILPQKIREQWTSAVLIKSLIKLAKFSNTYFIIMQHNSLFYTDLYLQINYDNNLEYKHVILGVDTIYYTFSHFPPKESDYHIRYKKYKLYGYSQK